MNRIKTTGLRRHDRPTVGDKFEFELGRVLGQAKGASS